MKKLTVFYDRDCPFCRRCHDWVTGQTSYVPIEFRALRDEATQREFPDLGEFAPDEDLVVFTDDGDVYRGTNAWLLILWALPSWRGWSFRLAQPALRPFVRRFWDWISTHRLALLPGRLGREEVLQRALAEFPEKPCERPELDTRKWARR